MRTIEQRVADGATFLDLHVVGWVDRIDLEALNIASISGDCTACQALGLRSVTQTFERLGISHLPEDRVAFGFATAAFDMAMAKVDFSALTAEWKRVIQQRRQQSVPAAEAALTRE